MDRDHAGTPHRHGICHLLEATLAISLKSASGIAATLSGDPRTESVSIDFVGLRDVGVTAKFDVSEQLAEGFLPLFG